MVINLKIVQNKALNLINHKMKKKKFKNKKLPLKDYANFVNKFLEKKFKKFKLDKD